MIQLDNRTVLEDGTVICSAKAIVEMLYADKDITSVVAEPCADIDMYNQADKFLDSNFGLICESNKQMYQGVNWFDFWLTPEHYKFVDVETQILSKCKTEQEFFRAQTELALFKERNMYPVLRHLMYLVDTWRANHVLWGVGRGSSVSSFVLYLIGINRINPLEFDLDIREFLK